MVWCLRDKDGGAPHYGTSKLLFFWFVYCVYKDVGIFCIFLKKIICLVRIWCIVYATFILGCVCIYPHSASFSTYIGNEKSFGGCFPSKKIGGRPDEGQINKFCPIGNGSWLQESIWWRNQKYMCLIIF